MKQRKKKSINQNTYDRSQANVAGMPKIKSPKMKGYEHPSQEHQPLNPDKKVPANKLPFGITHKQIKSKKGSGH